MTIDNKFIKILVTKLLGCYSTVNMAEIRLLWHEMLPIFSGVAKKISGDRGELLECSPRTELINYIYKTQ